MTNVRESKRAHHGRASKKAPKPRRRTIVAELTLVAEEIERLNDQLFALSRRGAR